MLRAIASLARADGSFPQAGMNHRTIFGPYVSQATIRKRAKAWAKGQHCRIEYYHHNNFFATKPLGIDYINVPS